jgi:hypothetical protein
MRGWPIGVVLCAKTNYLDDVLILVIEKNHEIIKSLRDTLNEEKSNRVETSSVKEQRWSLVGVIGR